MSATTDDLREARVTERPKRLPLHLATWNVGNGTLADAREVMAQVEVMALQEASDQTRLVNTLVREGYRLIRPTMTGAPATPLIYDPTVLTLMRPLVLPMLMGRDLDLGPGTGPDRAKPKWLVGGYFVHKPTQRRVVIGNTHRVPGQKDGNRRQRLAIQHARSVVDALDRYKGIAILLGDWNSEPDAESTGPLRHSGWTCDHLAGDRLPTHGGWCPDHVWWRRDERVRFHSHETIKNRSDHDALVVRLGITPRADAR